MHGWRGDRRHEWGEKWHPHWFIYSPCIHSHPRYLWCKYCTRIWAMPLGNFILCVCLCVCVSVCLDMCAICPLFLLQPPLPLSLNLPLLILKLCINHIYKLYQAKVSQGWRCSFHWCLTWWLNLSFFPCCETNVCSIPASQLVRWAVCTWACVRVFVWRTVHVCQAWTCSHCQQADWCFALFWLTVGSMRHAFIFILIWIKYKNNKDIYLRALSWPEQEFINIYSWNWDD